MPKLSKEQERELAARAKQGDREAIEQLIKIHEPLVRGIANDICKRHTCMDLQIILINEGQSALFEQIGKFDPNRGIRFSTFVYWRIDGAMHDYLWHNKYKDVYGSRTKWEFVRDVRLAHDELMNALPDMPTVEEIARYMTVSVAEAETVLGHKERLPEVDAKSIAERTGLPLWKVRRILNKHSAIKSKAKSPDLSAENVAEKLRVTPQAVDEALDIASEKMSDNFSADSSTPEEIAAKNERLENLHRAIQVLPDKERRVITLRYYEKLTMKEISETTGININAVKSRMRRARARLKNRLQDGGE